MFRSYNDQIRDATLDAKNNADLKKELDSFTRSKQLSMGVLPIEIEALNPNIQRDTAISLLKKYTYQPKAAYAYLFDNNGVDDFIKFNVDFDKMVRGVTNMSLEEFKSEWDYFTNVEMKTAAFKYRSRFAGPEERNKYERKEIKFEVKEDIKSPVIPKYQTRESAEKLVQSSLKKYDIIRRLKRRAIEEIETSYTKSSVTEKTKYIDKHNKIIELLDRIENTKSNDEIEKLLKKAEDILAISGSGIRKSRYKRPIIALSIPHQWDWQ